jgi:hypothetical protein
MPENSNSSKQPKRPKRVRRAPEFRRHAISPMLRWTAGQISGMGCVVLLLDADVEIRTLDELACYQAKELGISARTLWRWYRAFREFGHAGLVDAPRRDRGTSHFFTRRGVAAAFVIDKCFRGWKSSAIHRALVAKWPQLCHDGSRPPCRPTVRGYARSFRSFEVRS